jgi:raffinose/stachyose/melibiose transport system substrate-binding protein
MSIRAIIRYGSLAVILCLGTWALWPPPSEQRPQAAAGDASEPCQDARFVIKVAPGGSYLPGTQPFGLDLTLHGLTDVVADFEKRFPDTRIEIINVPSVREYLVTQLSSGQAPDIINVNVEDVWTDVQKGWYVPLDPFLEAPNPFVAEKGDPSLPGSRQWWDMFTYQGISRGKAAPDNKNYCLTYDMIETGIYYNKTLFEQWGVQPPQTWEEFRRILQRAREAGKIPLLMGLGTFNDWCTDLFFDQLYYSLLPGIDLVQDPVREKYLQGYLDWDEIAFLFGKGFFHTTDPRYREVWRLMKDLKQYTNRDMMGTDQLREFVTGNAAMLWSVSAIGFRLQADKELGFDWGVFYMPRFTKATTPYASNVDMCVIGGSGTQLEVTCSAIKDTDPSLSMAERMARSERLQRAVAFLQFLCVPENYRRIVNEYPCLLPNIKGVRALPVLKPFEKILERRYTTTKWVFTFDLRFSEIQSRMLGLYLAGGVDLDEYMQWQEDNIRAATENLRRRKPVDMAKLERVWQEKAPIRAKLKDLPPEPTEDKR